jgi:malonyl-CoA O-methyltransferase
MNSNIIVQNRFSKYANQYDNNNIIQRIVSKALVRELDFQPKQILELGCGSGQIYREILWQTNKYKAIDFSQNMCDIHPKNDGLEILCFDFDSDKFWDNIKNDKYDLVISSSALQWSKDLKKLLNNLSKISPKISTVLFTANTFKTIYNITKQKATILNTQEILKSFDDFQIEYEIINYKLEFKTKKEMFAYIKNSGTQGQIQLSYKEAKHLYKNYTLDYLEFEVIFIKSDFSLTQN